MKKSPPKRVLVLHEQATVIRMIKVMLEEDGYEVSGTRDGKTGLRLFFDMQPDAVILSTNLPPVDGHPIAHHIGLCCDIPILLLVDSVDSSEEGQASASLHWPASPKALLNTLQSLLCPGISRLENSAAMQTSSAAEPIILDKAQYQVLVREIFVKLTAREFHLLAYLMQHAGRYIGIHQILEQVWGQEHRGHGACVHTYIWRLRHKIEPDPEHPRYLLNEYGNGFCFAMPSG
jgi:DNA-binding response OmpR family regulator